MQVHFGIIEVDDGYRISERRIKDIEALMIYYHRLHYGQPIHNRLNTRGYYGRDLLIWNLGRRGLLENRVCTDDLSIC